MANKIIIDPNGKDPFKVEALDLHSLAAIPTPRPMGPAASDEIDDAGLASLNYEITLHSDAPPGHPLIPQFKHFRRTSPYGMRDDGFHYGMDIPTVSGSPIFAPFSGFLRYGYDPGPPVKAHGYGTYAIVESNHEQGTALFAHLSKQAKMPHDGRGSHKKGSNKILVRKGQIIGFSGNSGGSTGPHLHIGWSPLQGSRFSMASRSFVASKFWPFIPEATLNQVDTHHPNPKAGKSKRATARHVGNKNKKSKR